MKISSKKTANTVLLALLLTVPVLLWVGARHNFRLKKSIDTGRFETFYTTAIEAVQTQTRTIREKLKSNLPGNLEILPKEQLKTAALIHNPGRPADGEPPEPVSLRGIYWDETMPLAEIEDRLCKAGDSIGGFTLEEIQPYQIILSDETGNRTTNSLRKHLFTTR